MNRIGTIEKITGRRIARESWIEAKGNRTLAKQLAKAKAREVGISPAVILLIVRIAWLLIDYWFLSGILVPSLEFAPGEPDLEGAADAYPHDPALEGPGD